MTLQICDLLLHKKCYSANTLLSSLAIYSLLNSRQFSFINEIETGVKSYKEKIKLTLFAVDISSAKIATTHELQLHPSQELTFSFVERLITSNQKMETEQL